MKISDVCERTGLTDRAIRFYIEKGLLQKEAQNRNGRNCRDYDEEDVRILKDIAILRNNGFSIQDIMDMQNTPERIPTIIEERRSEMRIQCTANQHLLGTLEKARGREGISWRRLAGILESHPEPEGETVSFRWPDNEIVEDEDEKKVRMPKILKHWLLGVATAILAVGAMIAVYSYCQYHSELTVYGTLDEVVFHDIWVEDGNTYATITSNQVPPYGIGDEYFYEPKTLKLAQGDFWQAVITEDISYLAVNLRIEIPYGEAKKFNLLEERSDWSNRESVCLEKVLENEEYVKAYCTIERVQP